MGFIPLVLAIFHPKPGPVAPGLKRFCRLQDALAHTGGIFRMDDTEHRVCTGLQPLRLNTEQVTDLGTHKRVIVGLMISAEPVGKQNPCQSRRQFLESRGRHVHWLVLPGLFCHVWPVSPVLVTLIYIECSPARQSLRTEPYGLFRRAFASAQRPASATSRPGLAAQCVDIQSYTEVSGVAHSALHWRTMAVLFKHQGRSQCHIASGSSMNGRLSGWHWDS